MYIAICAIFACLAFCVAIGWHQYAKPTGQAGFRPPSPSSPDPMNATDWLDLQKSIAAIEASPLHESWRDYWHGLRHPK